MSIKEHHDVIVEIRKHYGDKTLRKQFFIAEELVADLDKDLLKSLLGHKVYEGILEVTKEGTAR